MDGCSCAVCPVSTVLCRCQAPRRHPPPGWFGRRGCKLLKIKNGGSKKRVKRDQRGCKLMKIREMPQSHRENGRNEEGQRGTPRGNSDGYQNTGLAGKAIRKNMKTKARRSRQGSQKAARRLCSGSIRVAGRTEET